MRNVRLLSIPMLLCAAQAAHADAKTCKAAALVFGSPMHTYNVDQQPNPAGQTVRQDPPLDWQDMVFKGDNVYTINALQELWGGPMNGAIKRLAGERQGRPGYADGPCASARFGNIWGLAIQRDGTIIIADHGASAVAAVSDPDKPTCKVTTLVGPKKPTDADKAPRGDADGPGATATLNRPAWPVVDSSGNIYVIDIETSNVRMIANDAAHTVSTVGKFKSGGGIEPYHGMTMVDDKLYSVTSTFSNGVVQELDPATKNVRVVKDGGGTAFTPLPSTQSPALTSITTDGNALLIFGRGYVWRLTPQGALTNIAGTGWEMEYPKGYNFAGVYPANQIRLLYRFNAGAAGSPTSMIWNKDAIYWRGVYNGAYVVKINCN